MRFSKEEILQSFTRGLSTSLMIFWLVGITTIFNFDKPFMIGLMCWVILVLATIISWKDELIGGGVFIIFGGSYLLLATKINFTLLGSAPFFVVGLLSIFHYYLEKKRGGSDDF